MKKAILFGATGFIGAYLLDELLSSSDYETVTIVVRKPLNNTHPKLNILIGDFNTLPQLKNSIIADEIFIALGTTKKQTPNKKTYYQIDHDYPVLAATLAKQNGATAIFVVSSVGANAHSNIFYAKTKGALERDIIALHYEHTHIFQPSMLLGNRKENRPYEKIFKKLFAFIDPLFFGNISKYKGIDGKIVAKAMVNAAKNQTEKVKIYQWQQMNYLV